MSEQEKMNAVPTEGTITTTEEKKPWFKRVAENPKVRKWAKRVAAGAGWALTAFAAFKLGQGTNGTTLDCACDTCENPNCKECEAEDDLLEES